MEEPGSLEVALNPVIGIPKGGARHFTASSLELEYGVNGWWTSELYLDAQKTGRDRALFTGYRFENRFQSNQILLSVVHNQDLSRSSDFSHINAALMV